MNVFDNAYRGIPLDDNCDHTCPECRDGKCRNCTGDAWCDYSDEPTECEHTCHTTEDAAA